MRINHFFYGHLRWTSLDSVYFHEIVLTVSPDLLWSASTNVFHYILKPFIYNLSHFLLQIFIGTWLVLNGVNFSSSVSPSRYSSMPLIQSYRYYNEKFKFKGLKLGSLVLIKSYRKLKGSSLFNIGIIGELQYFIYRFYGLDYFSYIFVY